MKKKKFLVKRWLFLMLIMAFTACTPPVHNKVEDNTGSKYLPLIPSAKNLSGLTVGYSSPSLNAPFYVSLSNAVKANVQAYGMRFLAVDGQGDISQQIKGIEDLIAQGVDVLIVNPLDPKALVPTINAASKSGIPVFIVDSYIDPSAEYVVSVLADNEGNGDLLGQWAADVMKGRQVIAAIISGAQGNPVGRQKRMGFISGLADQQLASQGSSTTNYVSQGWGGWSISNGRAAMEDILVAHPDVNLVMAENDEMAIGALQAIEASKIKNQITIIGVDGQKEALQLIKEGKLGATALNSPAELGKLVVQSSVKFLNGENAKGVVIHTPAVLISKSNVNNYYDPKATF